MIKKYSLRDFLTSEIELINKGAQSQKIRIHKVEIPMIQRDYAQGRLTASSTQKNELPKLNSTGAKFISELFLTLTDESANSEMELDFIYGSIAEIEDAGQIFNYFYPLDGQQRLTTLYLLYWFVGGAELDDEKKRELADILVNFFYSTRSSSNAFCQQLVSELTKNEIDFFSHNAENLVSQIENLSWFHNSYKRDPTVFAMLNMLDKIQELYLTSKCKNLFPKLEKLRFYILPLTNFDLTEELYVKMNARGKQLSNFENFKADLQHWIRRNSSNYAFSEKYYAGRMMPYDMMFINKMDNEWSQCFWSANKNSTEHSYDSIFLKFLYRYWCNEYVLQNDTTKSKELESTTEFAFFTTEPEYAGFTPFGEQIASSDFVENLEFVLDQISIYCNDILNKSKPCWGTTPFKLFSFDTYKLLQRAVFGAIILYLKNLKKKNVSFNADSFEDWMHVSWNIIENADIDHGNVYIGVLYLLNELADYSDDIYRNLANPEIKISSQQSKESLAEEQYKACLIVKDSNWKSLLRQAESHQLFRGSVSFLLPPIKEIDSASIDDFKHKYELAQIFFDANGISPNYKENGHLFLRALISRYEKLSDIRYHITDSVEKENSLKSMLMSDNVVRSAINEWFSLDDENAVKLRLEQEIEKESPISTIESDYENKIHQALYKESDLISWMQANGAIRFKDGFVSRPSSSKDWVYVNGYRNEIITALIAKGWECNNRCRLDSREINYFWSPTVGEITLTKKITDNDSEMSLSCAIESKSGVLSIRVIDTNVTQTFNYMDEVTHSDKLSDFVEKVDTWRPVTITDNLSEDNN